MGFEEIARSVIDFVRENQAWAAPVVFMLAFGESLAFLSLMVPGIAALFGIGAVMGVSGISFWPVWIAAATGAALGDWVSYWIGNKFKSDVARMWPLSRYPDLLPTAERFVSSWGVPGIFIGRFFGPLRAFVPLAAGIFEMPYWRFQYANFTSAFVWSAVVLSPGMFGLKMLMSYFGMVLE
jgi:membrane protein DedA with SNARE-associated domain